MLKRGLLTLSCLVCLAGLAVGQDIQEITATEKTTAVSGAVEIAGLKDAVEGLIDEGRLAGAVVMVLHRDQVVFVGSYGKQALSPAAAMQRNSIFRIYSMSKPITCAAAMTLVESGKLKLDSPISDYLPEMKNVGVYAGGDGSDLATVAAKKTITVLDL